MYFIAYFDVPKLHVIIPKTWIMEVDKHWEKFVNNSINRNQKHLCFYSERPGAMIDREDDEKEPDTNYVPDFTLDRCNIFPTEGCYTANLVTYKGLKKHIPIVIECFAFVFFNLKDFFLRII